MACGWHVDGWQGSNSVALSLFLLLFARKPQESDECHAACTKEGIKVPFPRSSGIWVCASFDVHSD